ncbi:MAG: metallophosphoesterase family protein [Nitrososphaeria archaeon]|jgi:predicted phosphodiesterase
MVSKMKNDICVTKLFELDQVRFRRLNKLIVVGDVHGDIEVINSLLRIFEPSKDVIIFLGDYADRGPNGIEVIDTINFLKDDNPQSVIALKGNHEDYSYDGIPLFYPCDLITEAERKRGNWQKYFLTTLQPFLKKLYLATILPREYLFVHGGISSKILNTESLRKATKQIEIDILWSDPFEGKGERPNSRGTGIFFGEDVTDDVCKRLAVKRIIRSHEPTKSLFEPAFEHSGKVVTVSSTHFYGGKPFVLVIYPSNPSDLSYQFL